MDALMRELVDGRTTRILWWVTHPESEIGHMQASTDLERPEDHAKAPRRLRQVDLRAVGQHGAVASFALDSAQMVERNPILFVGSPGSLGGLTPSRGCSREVFLPSVGIEMHGEPARR